MSKSSRWTRIIASASGDRRKEGDLVTVTDGMARLDVFLVDGDAHHRKILERLGEAGAAPPQPAGQRRDVADTGGHRDILPRGAGPPRHPGEKEGFHLRLFGRPRGPRTHAPPR